MCDPFTIISAGLSVAGSFVQAQQQQAMVDAQNAANRQAYELSRQARQRELERQAQFEQEAHGEWEGSLKFLTPEEREGRFEALQDEFLSALDARPSSADQGLSLSGQDRAGPEFQGELAKAIATRADDTRQRLAALAKLGAYGGNENRNAINLGQVNNNLNTLGGIRRGSLGVSQFEQQVPAATVSGGSSFLGDILSGLGGLAGGMGGGMGGGGGMTVRPKGVY